MPIGVILGIYWDNGKENGNYYLGFMGLGSRVSGLEVWEFGSLGVWGWGWRI